MSPRSKSSTPALKDAEWLRWSSTARIFDALGSQGDMVRAVGGAVRDTLLGRNVQDVDFATDAAPERVMDLARAAGLKAVPTGMEHGTVTIVADHRGFEVTTLRKDVETFGRRAKVAFTDDWAADASRRDFTINAIYADADGTLFDPLGSLSDIEAHRVRFIGDPRTRIREDFLRILRFFRFNAELETGEFDQEALRACVSERSGLNSLSGERVNGEVTRLLSAGGAVRAVWKMFDHGLLTDVLRGVPNPVRLERLVAIEAVLHADADALLRLACLGVAVKEDAERLVRILRLSNADRDRLARFAESPPLTPQSDDMNLRRALHRHGKAGCRDAALKSWASSGAPTSDDPWRDLITRLDEMPVPEFPLQGADLVKLGLPEGPDVGKVLRRVEAQWLEKGCVGAKDTLLKMARTMIVNGAVQSETDDDIG